LGGGVTFETLPPSPLKTATLIDGQGLVQAIGRPNDANTFFDLADSFFRAVCSKPGARIDLVFDRYLDESIKGGTRNRRTCGNRNRHIRRIIEKQFMGLSKNTSNLADFLSNELMDLYLFLNVKL